MLKGTRHNCATTLHLNTAAFAICTCCVGLFGVAGLYVSKGRPLMWWYGGVKVALRIDSRDASDFAKKFDLNL